MISLILRNRLPGLFLITISSFACTKNQDEILFKFEYDQFIVVPGGLNTLETYSFVLRELPTNYKALLNTFQVDTAAITAIKPGAIRLSDEFNQFDFSRIEKISLLMSKVGFQNEVEIGYLEEVPYSSANILQLFPTLVDTRNITSQEKFNVKLKIKLRSFLSNTTNMRLRFTLNAIR